MVTMTMCLKKTKKKHRKLSTLTAKQPKAAPEILPGLIGALIICWLGYRMCC